MRMRAIVCQRYGGPEVMRYEEVPRPRPADGDVLIQAEAIGVNFVDVMRRSGRHPTAPRVPFSPGVEVCGRVADVGPGVTKFQAGERVIGRCQTHGTYAEFVCTEERFTVACPDELSPEQGAALFVNGQTAYHALLTMGRVEPGQWTLVTAAAGGVGTCAVQVAKLLGAKVVAAASTAEKRELARRLGADVRIDYTHDDWPDRVVEATGGCGADLILESVGGEVARSSLRCWAPGGRMVVYGQASGSPITITGADLLFGNRVAYGLAVGTVIENESLMREAMARLVAWVRDGKLELQIGRVYPLREAPQAHADLESRGTQGKLILIP